MMEKGTKSRRKRILNTWESGSEMVSLCESCGRNQTAAEADACLQQSWAWVIQGALDSPRRH
jgi:hypothetical protein